MLCLLVLLSVLAGTTTIASWRVDALDVTLETELSDIKEIISLSDACQGGYLDLISHFFFSHCASGAVSICVSENQLANCNGQRWEVVNCPSNSECYVDGSAFNNVSKKIIIFVLKR